MSLLKREHLALYKAREILKTPIEDTGAWEREVNGQAKVLGKGAPA